MENIPSGCHSNRMEREIIYLNNKQFVYSLTNKAIQILYMMSIHLDNRVLTYILCSHFINLFIDILKIFEGNLPQNQSHYSIKDLKINYYLTDNTFCFVFFNRGYFIPCTKYIEHIIFHNLISKNKRLFLEILLFDNSEKEKAVTVSEIFPKLINTLLNMEKMEHIFETFSELPLLIVAGLCDIIQIMTYQEGDR